MQSDRTRATWSIGAFFMAICCGTPLLVSVLGALGLTAWLAEAVYVVIPVLLIGLTLVAIGLYRRRAAKACCDAAAPEQGKKT